MSRFNRIVTLYDVEQQRNARGQVVGELELPGRRVYANQYSIGLTSWAAGASKNLHADAVYMVRSGEYHGETRARVRDVAGNDVEYEIEEVSDMGGSTRLILRRRLVNGQ
jgi:hypothetical protein